MKKEDSEETSPRKNKAKILSAKARGGSEADMSGYMAFEMTTSLSDKVRMPKNQEEDLSNKARETPEGNGDEKTSQNGEDEELRPIYPICLLYTSPSPRDS